jgi:hypothetical protein
MFDSILYIVQYTLNFMMMLIAMTFNLWLNLTLILGLTFGYYIFDSKKFTNLQHAT